MARAERGLGYAVLGMITPLPVSSSSSAEGDLGLRNGVIKEEDEEDEDEQGEQGERRRSGGGVVNNDEAWCW